MQSENRSDFACVLQYEKMKHFKLEIEKIWNLCIMPWAMGWKALHTFYMHNLDPLFGPSTDTMMIIDNSYILQNLLIFRRKI